LSLPAVSTVEPSVVSLPALPVPSVPVVSLPNPVEGSKRSASNGSTYLPALFLFLSLSSYLFVYQPLTTNVEDSPQKLPQFSKEFNAI